MRGGDSGGFAGGDFGADGVGLIQDKQYCPAAAMPNTKGASGKAFSMKLFRLHHLLFGVAVIAAWLTSESTGVPHAWIGYAVAALLLLRLLLAAAHKSGFELRRLLPSFSKPPVGQTGLRHPAIMRSLILILFVAIATTAGTGIAMDKGGTLIGQSIRLEGAHEEHEGPGAREESGEHEESALAEVHETVGNLLLPLVAIHIVYMLILRRDLALYLLFWPRRRKAA